MPTDFSQFNNSNSNPTIPPTSTPASTNASTNSTVGTDFSKLTLDEAKAPINAGISNFGGGAVQFGLDQKDFPDMLKTNTDNAMWRAVNQPGIDQFGNMVGKLIPHIVGGVLSSFGAVGELPARISGNYDYHNSLSDLG